MTQHASLAARRTVTFVAVASTVLAIGVPAAQAKPHQRPVKITTTISSRVIVAGHPATVSGTVSRHAPRERVQLQLGSGRKWSTIATSRIGRHGGYSLKTPALSPGQRVLRIATPTTKSLKAGYGPRVKARAERWIDLSTVTPVQNSITCIDDPIEIDGTTYLHSLSWNSTNSEECDDSNGWGDSGSISYNLKRQCYSFTGVGGMNDDTDPQGQAELTITGDGTTESDTVMDFGSRYPITINLSGVLRLQLAVNVLNPDPFNDIGSAVGTPQVLCAF